MKEPKRHEIRDLMSEFLNKGGQIVEVPAYVSAENVDAYRPMTQQEKMAVKLRCGLKANAKMTLVYRPQERLWHATVGINSLGFHRTQQAAEAAIMRHADKVFFDISEKTKKREQVLRAKRNAMVSENVCG